jgi:hypothetical protein
MNFIIFFFFFFISVIIVLFLMPWLVIERKFILSYKMNFFLSLMQEKKKIQQYIRLEKKNIETNLLTKPKSKSKKKKF